MDDIVQVSIYCLAYNHEKYIRKTLEGFVNQKTDFPFKVVIHDDASTDRTAEIIREYEERYPEIIEAIYQKENQYSKDPDAIDRCITPRLEGKYIAFCEGDDYWCDENKLQKQYNIMEENPEMVFCIHRVGLISEDGTPLKATYPARKLPTGYLSSRQFIEGVCEDFFQLSSFFCRLDTYLEYIENIPQYARLADVGDIPLFLFLGDKAKQIYFIDEIMSRYRVNSASSVTLAISKDKEKQIYHLNRMIAMIDSFDQYTMGHYHTECDRYRERETFETYVKLKNIYQIIKNRAFRERFRRLPLRAQASIAVKGVFLAVKTR